MARLITEDVEVVPPEEIEIEQPPVVSLEDDGGDGSQRSFWPKNIAEDPVMLFLSNYVFLPLLILWLVWAYYKTCQFAYNTLRFYQRHKKNLASGDFNKRGHHGRHGKGDKHEKSDGHAKKEKAASKSDNFKREK